MYLYKIAVITENSDIADFFRLELNLFHIGVKVFTTPEKLDGTYLFVVVDTDTCEMPADTQYTLIPLSERYDTRITKEGCRLGWPLLLTDVQRLSGVAFTDGEIPTLPTAVQEESMFIAMSTDQKEAELNGRIIKLSKNEYAILSELCENCGKTVNRTRIMEILEATDGNISDVYICHLRKKLESDTGRRLIFTERGKGYYTVLRKK